jgi:hypothetical protein
MPTASTFDPIHSPPPAPSPRPTSRAADLALVAALGLATWGVWYLSRTRAYTAGSDLGYWLGVAGGVMMLLLFAYPLRKRWAVLARFGKAKYWFIVHMVLGIGGPLMVLAHSTFRVGSVNAGVALFSMLLVSASGVVGRFLYLRIHRGLGGERLTLAGLRTQLGLGDAAVTSRLHFAPEVERQLTAFLARHAGSTHSWSLQARRLLVLPWVAFGVRRRCCREADHCLRELARRNAWSAAELRTQSRQARRLVAQFTQSVLRVAQFTAFVRLFSLWHVLHVPFVYLMVLCAVVHVVAVHAY